MNLVRWSLIIITLVTIGVLVRLPSHFWLDETMSYWTADAGFHQLVLRCIQFPQSVLYSTMILGLRSLGVHTEWIYRLPSFLAVAASAWLLFRMTRRLFGSEAAWLTTALFVLTPSVAFAAGDARPYGLALLLVVVATDMFVRFLNRPDYKLAALYGLSAAGVLYFHVLFGAVLLAHPLFLLYRARRGQRMNFSYLAAALLVFVMAATPVIVQYAHMSGSMASHSFADRPNLEELAISYLPGDSLYLFLFLAVLALLAGTGWRMADAGDWPLLVVLWALLPPLLLFAASRVSPARLFIPRYYLSYAPGLAICLALILTAFRSAWARSGTLVILALLAIRFIGIPPSFHHAKLNGDWGGAAASVNRYLAQNRVPVLVRSQFPESNYLPLTPVEGNGAFAQLSYYPINAPVIPLPVVLTEADADSLRTTLRNLPPATHRLLLVSFPGPSPDDAWVYYLRGLLGPGCTVRELSRSDGVAVTEYSW
jgi:uncharacterized membrane protein